MGGLLARVVWAGDITQSTGGPCPAKIWGDTLQAEARLVQRPQPRTNLGTFEEQSPVNEQRGVGCVGKTVEGRGDHWGFSDSKEGIWNFFASAVGNHWKALSLGIIWSGSILAQMIKNLPAMQIQSLGWEDPLEEGMQPTPEFLHGKSHGQKGLTGSSP